MRRTIIDSTRNTKILPGTTSQEKAVTAAVAVAAVCFYALVGADIGAGALDSDTLSLVVSWNLLREGVAVDHWQLAVPKLLPIVLDGLSYEIGGLPAVLARSVLTSALMVAAAFWFLGRAYSAAAGVIVGVFLLADRALWEGTFGGNSTVLFLLCLLGAAATLLDEHGAEVNVDAGVWLIAAALVRQEGVAFVGLLGAVFAWPARKRGAGAVASRAALVAVVVAAVLASHAVISMALTSDALSSHEIARGNAEALRAVAAAQDAPRAGFLTTFVGFLAQLLRPLPWYLVIVPLGWYAATRRSRRAGAVLAALALVPVLYCWALYSMGLPLFERFLLPTAVAAHLCAAAGYLHLWRVSDGRLAGLPPHVAKALIALIALGALAVTLRDTWHSHQGYLLAESRARRTYAEGLRVAAASPSAEGPVLVSGLHHPYAILQGPWGARDVRQDQFVLAAGPEAEELSRFRYILYDRHAAVMQRLLAPYSDTDPPERLRIGAARYQVIWASADGRFKFFHRVTTP